jgi:hypothetical protein
MRRVLCIASCFALAAVAIGQQEQLPKADPNDELEIDPPLLIKDGKPLVPIATPEAPAGDPQQLALAVERAKRAANAADRQVKVGIISKVQAEDRALKVLRLEHDLANARLETAKQEHADKQQQFDEGKATQPELDEAVTAERAADEAARAASENLHRAELDAARTNVERQKKLLALGSGHRSDVNRAEEKLSQLNSSEE